MKILRPIFNVLYLSFLKTIFKTNTDSLPIKTILWVIIINNTVERPISNHQKCEDIVAGRLQEVVTYKNRTTWGLFWEEVQTHLL